PWKTADGGKNWSHMKEGIIDDSDVFSIIVDPRNANNIYLSACSGIYKSENAGTLFHKIQGIPFSARRTRVLQQDPSDSNVVYAGTTEGLWKTADAGRTWKRMTAPNVIVNDVLVDPRHSQRVLLATDRSGVQASNNAGLSFTGSNAGFAHRQVATVIADHHDSSILYAGLINDKEYGGVFKTSDSGAHWTQMSSGLSGRDVFALAQDEKGTLIAGTNRGIFAYSPSQVVAAKSAVKSKVQRTTAGWTPLDRISNETIVVVRKATKTRKALTRKTYKTGKLDARVADIRITKDKWYAATSMGIFTSANHGKTWQGGPIEGNTSFLAIHVQPSLIMAAGRNNIVASVDGGNSWYTSKVPQIVTSIVGLCSAPDNSVWFASREGAYRSSDGGETWERITTLPIVDLASCKYDEDSKRMLVTGMRSTEIFQSEDSGHTWRHSDTGWLLRSLLDEPGRLVATTAFDGVVLEQSAVAQAAETRSTSSEGSNKQ
ncbi:MAG TPA: transcriptional regulator, partial [Terriglobales bacterium]